MSAADVLSPFGSLVAALVARETDHERIAAACGVSKELPHGLRTAAILATLRFCVVSRDAWAREALDARARLADADEARRGAFIMRDAWRDSASAAAAGLARVASALGIGPVSEHPQDAPRVAAACVAAAEALTDRPTADTQPAASPLACGEDHADPCEALDALADVAEALDAFGESGRASYNNADQIARACLAKIASDHETTERFLASAEATRARLDAAVMELDACRAELANLRGAVRAVLDDRAHARPEAPAAIADAAARRRAAAASEGER